MHNRSFPLLSLRLHFIKTNKTLLTFTERLFTSGTGDLLCNEDLDQSCMAAGGSSVQRRPQLIVLSVDTGSSVQQDLYHLLIVIYTTLHIGRRQKTGERMNVFNFWYCNTRRCDILKPWRRQGGNRARRDKWNVERRPEISKEEGVGDGAQDKSPML